MKITVDRKWKKEDYTIGRMYINGEFFCNTLEDTDRGITQTMDKNILRSRKIPNHTAIPSGIYDITLDVVSPKFSKKTFYKEFCDGMNNVHIIHVKKEQHANYACCMMDEEKQIY